jgi:predicted transcriptional regulator
MPLPTFHEWLRSAQDAPAAEQLATVIAQAGAAGISRGRIEKALGLPSETLNDLLKALVATGQVTMLRVNGELTYRAGV